MCSSSTGALEAHSTHFQAGRPDLHLPLDPPAGGLQMAHTFEHIPVLRDEVVSLFASVPPGVLVDATLGGGGHAAALLEAYPGSARRRCGPGPDGTRRSRGPVVDLRRPGVLCPRPVLVIGAVIVSARDRGRPLSGCSSTSASARCSSTGRTVASPSARTVPSTCGWTHRPGHRRRPGEHPSRGRPRRALPRERRRAAGRPHRPRGGGRPAGDLDGPTGQCRVVGGSGGSPTQGPPGPTGVPGPAHSGQRRTGPVAHRAPRRATELTVDGVCVVISYHSGEDRFVKQTFAEAASGGCVCPPGMPCVCGAVPHHRLLFRGARKASPAEVAANPRAESARLRAIVRTDED